MTTESMAWLDASPFSLPSNFFDRFDGHDDARQAREVYDAFLRGESAMDASFTGLTDQKSQSATSVMLSIMALLEFYRQNWIGPQGATVHPLLAEISALGHSLDDLVADGEFPYPLIRRPELLIYALTRLGAVLQATPEDSTVAWWYARALLLHLRVLDAPCSGIRTTLRDTVLAHHSCIMARSVDFEERARYALEAATMAQECEDEKMAESFLAMAADAAGMRFELVGRLGRRTIHQSFDVLQLTVAVSRASESDEDRSCAVEGSAIAHPANVALNDDHLRETVQYTDDRDNDSRSLRHTDLAILLAHVRQQWRFHVRDPQTVEKMRALVAAVLEAPNSWQIYSAGLFWRSKLELEGVRTMERACLQFKALTEQINLDDALPRDAWTFAVWFPTEWECDREQALLFARLGAFKTALDIFHRRRMVDEAVQCLMSLDRIEDAEQLVETQLALTPRDPKLICALGDVKRRVWDQRLAKNSPDASEALQLAQMLYRDAWAASNERFSRAQRSLGAIYYTLGDFTKTIEALSLAVALNPLFESSWFLIGFASLQLDDMQGAVRAFSRVVTLNQDAPEAWRHLAHCHVKLGALGDAHRALLQLTRLQFDLNEPWQSLFSVALAVGEPLDAIRALRRHVETLLASSASFTTREADLTVNMVTQLVSLVTRVCLDDRVDAASVEHREMTLPVKRQFDTLLLEYLAQHTPLSGIAEFWIQVARYFGAGRRGEHAAQRKEALMKAYRSMQRRPYDRDPSAFRLMVHILESLRDTAGDSVEDNAEELQLLVSGVKRRCAGVFEEYPEYARL